MNLKKMIINSILLAIGAVLHQITPPLILGMKPDLSLAMLFIILVFNREYKTCLCAGIVAGILAAATTAFPGGQFANVIDKFVTINIMFVLIKPLRDRINNQITILLVTAVGTIISGSTFLMVVLLTVGLKTSFTALFLSVVLPAAVINTIAGAILFNIINVALKRGAIRQV
ncbi:MULTISPECIES: tryptophan transporter [Clostridium]|mgnify:CR=1 FL=1|jgi:ABC-type multidrug transport system fused ATPase/permease subunit|uniref:Putative tryptophan transport protein n=1 Tax=Clostridium ragsdalei P11 TaxID=1353534 RepID=A0A1A6AJS3_9CLOT|nr:MULTISPECIES: tryptophan transporter [Clostridium]OBR90322.1 putative tryptophan transport protein [Clostridium ragsdalei P11]QXE18126.1 tryptophan transporter [Clostridium sp. 001]